MVNTSFNIHFDVPFNNGSFPAQYLPPKVNVCTTSQVYIAQSISHKLGQRFLVTSTFQDITTFTKLKIREESQNQVTTLRYKIGVTFSRTVVSVSLIPLASLEKTSARTQVQRSIAAESFQRPLLQIDISLCEKV